MKKVLAPIGDFLKTEVVDLENDFKNAGKAIGSFIKKEETAIEPIITALIADIQALKKQAATDAITAAIAAAKQLLTALVAAL